MKHLLALILSLTFISNQAIAKSEMTEAEKVSTISKAMHKKIDDLNAKAETAIYNNDLDNFHKYKCTMYGNLLSLVKYLEKNKHIEGVAEAKVFFDDKLRKESKPFEMNNVPYEKMCAQHIKP